MPANSVFFGEAFSFVQIELYVNDVPIAGIKGISYKDNLTRGDVYGTASVQLGLTRGKYKADASIEFYKRAYLVAFLNLLGPGWRQVQMPIVVNYGPNDDGLIQTDTIPVAIVNENASDNSESDGDPLSNKVSFYVPQQILWGGFPGILETFQLVALA